MNEWHVGWDLPWRDQLWTSSQCAHRAWPPGAVTLAAPLSTWRLLNLPLHNRHQGALHPSGGCARAAAFPPRSLPLTPRLSLCFFPKPFHLAPSQAGLEVTLRISMTVNRPNEALSSPERSLFQSCRVWQNFCSPHFDTGLWKVNDSFKNKENMDEGPVANLLTVQFFATARSCLLQPHRDSSQRSAIYYVPVDCCIRM